MVGSWKQQVRLGGGGGGRGGVDVAKCPGKGRL